MRRVFVSGATGYIGGAISRGLAGSHQVFAGIRQPAALPPGLTPVVTGNLEKFDAALPHVDAVIHAAGLGHRRGLDTSVWHAANVAAAVNLARAARAGGATRFILISTAHVHGRVSQGVVTDGAPPNPMDDYAASKLAAEQDVAAAFGPGLVIIRPVAVIGPACPGHLPLLIKCLRRRLPLPFASIRNRRAFIDVEDLAALAAAALTAEAAPATILAAHPEPISTPDLISALAAGIGIPARLLPFPAAILAAAAAAAGRAAMWQSLAGSFVADPQNALGLGWTPRRTLRDSLMATSRYDITTNQNT